MAAAPFAGDYLLLCCGCARVKALHAHAVQMAWLRCLQVLRGWEGEASGWVVGMLASGVRVSTGDVP